MFDSFYQSMTWVCTMMHIVSVECSNKYRALSMWRRAAIGWLTARCSQLTNDWGLTTLTGHTLVTIGQMQRPGPQWPLVSTGGGAQSATDHTIASNHHPGELSNVWCPVGNQWFWVLSFRDIFQCRASLFIEFKSFGVIRPFVNDFQSKVIHDFNLAFHDK